MYELAILGHCFWEVQLNIIYLLIYTGKSEIFQQSCEFMLTTLYKNKEGGGRKKIKNLNF